jgi:hypothetical protein
VTDNDTLADLRARYPELADDHIPTWHKAIADAMRHRFLDRWKTVLAVEDVRIVTRPGDKAPAQLIAAGRPDLLLDVLTHATGVPGGVVGRTACADCDGSLDTNDRTYCRRCKTRRNRREYLRRKDQPATAPEARLDLGTYAEFLAAVGPQQR